MATFIAETFAATVAKPKSYLCMTLRDFRILINPRRHDPSEPQTRKLKFPGHSGGTARSRALPDSIRELTRALPDSIHELTLNATKETNIFVHPHRPSGLLFFQCTFTVTGREAIPLATTCKSLNPLSAFPGTSKVVDALPV